MCNLSSRYFVEKCSDPWNDSLVSLWVKEHTQISNSVNITTLGVVRRGVENVLSDLSERLFGAFGHSLGHVLSESVSQ
jgi:hypothetical protein